MAIIVLRTFHGGTRRRRLRLRADIVAINQAMKRLATFLLLSSALVLVGVTSASAGSLAGHSGELDEQHAVTDEMMQQPITMMRNLEDSGLEFEDLSGTPMHEVILTSLKVYGSLFAALFVVFLLGRHYYPKAFLALRDSEEATDLSRNTFGPISWIWKVFGVGDEEIFEECGMDAVSVLEYLLWRISRYLFYESARVLTCAWCRLRHLLSISILLEI